MIFKFKKYSKLINIKFIEKLLLLAQNYSPLDKMYHDRSIVKVMTLCTLQFVKL